MTLHESVAVAAGAMAGRGREGDATGKRPGHEGADQQGFPLHFDLLWLRSGGVRYRASFEPEGLSQVFPERSFL
jgi:hypothetical protein